MNLTTNTMSFSVYLSFELLYWGGGGVGSNVMHTQNGLCMFLLVIIQILVFLPLELAHPFSSPIYFKMRIIAVYVLM